MSAFLKLMMDYTVAGDPPHYYFSEWHENLCVSIAYLGGLVTGLLCSWQSRRQARDENNESREGA